MTIHTKASLALSGFILFFLIGVGFIRHAVNADPFDTIKVEGGMISGVMNATGDVHEFKGIPFAAPPVGKLRWKAPRPVISWKGVKVCDRPGPSPMQKDPVPFSMWSAEWLIPKEPISEDCLYLNVWTGAADPKEKRPVLLWIYGGGFVSGGSAVPIYDGEAMARKGVVVVSCNYRVGIFGFFAHPELTAESPHNASGNYGLLDQIAALQWIKKNIAAFGGDPDNVTIAGQSAGSMSVNCLVASPLARNLFQKAIGESGAVFTSKSPSLQQAEENGQQLLQLLQVDGINELRAMPANELLRRAYGSREPIVDGYVVPEAIVDIFKEGKENNVALLTGWNKDESDTVFGVQNYTWANMESKQGKKVYVYRFARKLPATGQYIKYGAFHSGEVPYVFDNLRLVDRPWEPIDHQLATLMSAYWANFIKTGDPNGGGLPVWAPYRADEKKIMMIGSDKQETELMTNGGRLDSLYAQMSGME